MHQPGDKGILFNIQKFSIHDGPGIRTVIFFKGCPLSCIWCSNPESQKSLPELGYNKTLCMNYGKCFEVCKTGALVLKDKSRYFYKKKCNLCGECVKSCPTNALTIFGKEYSVKEVMDEVKKDIKFYERSNGGVTLSGGEPFMQPGFSLAILMECKKLKIHAAIETCGYTKWKNIEKLSKYIDLFFYDVKIIDEKNHRLLTSKSNKLILENLEKLSSLNKPIIIRIPIIPDCTDSERNILEIAKFLKNIKNIKFVEMMLYHNFGLNKYRMLNKRYKLKKTKRPSNKRLESLIKIFKTENNNPVKVST